MKLGYLFWLLAVKREMVSAVRRIENGNEVKAPRKWSYFSG